MSTLDPILEVGAPPSMSLEAAMEYAESSQGSGFRHQLTLRTALACGLDSGTGQKLADGLEAFHNASLVFDDLPSMDDARERRGRPCLHLVAGEGQAVLAALALVNKAYTFIWQAAARQPSQSGKIARLVEHSIGTSGILDGQSRDLGFCSRKGAKEVRSIAVLKTGRLLKLSVLLPARLGGVSRGEYLYLSRLSRYWGIVYQALDDFSDLLISERPSGKTPMRDFALERPNLVVAMGIQRAHQELTRMLCRAENQVSQLTGLDSRWAFLERFHAHFTAKEADLSKLVDAA